MPPAELLTERKLSCIFRVQRDGSIKSTSWFVEPQADHFRVLQWVTDNLHRIEGSQETLLHLDLYHIQVLPEQNSDIWSVLIYLASQQNLDDLTSEDVFYAMFRNSSIPTAVLDLQGRCEQVNGAMTTLLQYSRDELLSMSFQNLIHPDDLRKDLQEMLLLIEGRIRNSQLIKRVIAREGQLLWVLLHVSVILNAQGDPRFLLVQLHNETENMQYREHLEHTTLMMEEAQRRAGMATFQIDAALQTVVFSGSVREMVGHWKGTVRFSVLQADLEPEEFERFLQWVQVCQGVRRATEVQIRLSSGRLLLLRGWADQQHILGVILNLTEQPLRIS